MKLSIDNFVRSAHPICQDYSLIGPDYAFLTDGCSSSPRSEIGAHLVPFLAERSHLADVDFMSFIKRYLNEWPLSGICFDTTLLSCHMKYDKLMLELIGDSCIIIKNKNGHYELHITEYRDNAPPYVSYFLDEKKRELYKKQFPNNAKIYKWRLLNDKFEDIENDYYVCEENIERDDWFLECSGIEDVFISTDGIKSFRDNTGQPVPMVEVIKEITAIKSYTGAFLQRRMNKMIKDFSQKGIIATDDISVVAFHFGEKDESI